IYHHPATEFVHTFIGKTNQFYGIVEAINGSNLRVETEFNGTLDAHNQLRKFAIGEKVTLYVRPEHIQLSLSTSGMDSQNGLIGNISMISFLGATTEYHITVGTHQFIVQTQQPHSGFVEGVSVLCHWDPEDLLVLKREG
ncbi:MAG: TOBE domain-containing protein, partial [Bacilli bacterium]